MGEINSSMKLLNSEMKKSMTSFSENNKSLKALKEQSQIAAEQVEKQREKVTTLKKAVEDATKKYGENSEEVKKWKTSLNKAETDLVKMEKSLADIEKQTKGLGKVKTVFNEWKEKLQNVKDKLSPVTEGLKKMGTAALKVAKVTFKTMAAGIAAVGTAAVVAGKKLWSMAGEAASAGDEIDKQSQKMQMSASEYQKLAYAAELSGTNMTTMQKAQKSLMSSGSKLDLVDALKQCADASDVASAATQMFGSKTAQELLPMLNQGSAGIEAMMSNAEKLGMVMSDDAVKASAKYQDSLSTLKNTFSAVKNGIVSNLLPGLTQAMDGFTGLLSGSENAKEEIILGVKSMVESLKTIAPQITAVFSTVIGAVSEIAPEIITSLVSGIIENIEPLFDAAFAIIESLCKSLLDKNNITEIIKAAVNLITKLVEGLTDNIDEIIDGAFIMIDALVTALLDNDNLQKIIQASIELITKLVVGLLDHLPDLVSAGLQLIKGLIKGLWDNRNLVFDSIKKIGKGIINAIKEILKINSPSKVFSDIGKNLIQGMVNGIGDAAKWVFDKIRNLGHNIIEVAKSVLGIHSPSKEFEKLGDFTGQGFGVGFVKSMASVRKKMAEALPTDMKSEIGVKLKTSIEHAKNFDETPFVSSKTNDNKSFNFNISIKIDSLSEGKDLNKLAEEIAEKIFRNTKSKLEAFV